MAGAVQPDCGRHAPQSKAWIFLKYYAERDIFTSTEGILKLLSVVACVCSAVAALVARPCGAPALVAVLAVAAAEASLVAAHALQLPLRAPLAFLYMDIIVSSVGGVAVLVTGALGLAACELAAALAYVPGALTIVTAGMLVGSAALTYSAAMQLGESAASPARPAPPPTELEV